MHAQRLDKALTYHAMHRMTMGTIAWTPEQELWQFRANEGHKTLWTNIDDPKLEVYGEVKAPALTAYPATVTDASGTEQAGTAYVQVDGEEVRHLVALSAPAPEPVSPTLAAAIRAVAERAAGMDGVCPKRLAKALDLALGGAVTMLPDGHAGSVRRGDRAYTVNRSCECECEDFRRGRRLCKHRLAVALYRRACEAVAREAVAQEDVASPAPQPASVATLPEAPASVNVRVRVGGHEVQWTLRDTCEQRLAVRLAALLAQYPAARG